MTSVLGGREAQVARLAAEQFDVAIVGGGISGAGIALDLAARGLRVALVEQGDFASGTSSRSSKLIHGGLRYLAQYQLGVTREAVHERHLLQRLAPALVEPLPFVIAVFDGVLEAARVAFGLSLYDAFAGRENTRHFAFVRRHDLRFLAPGLDTSELTAAYVYHDCRTDDARLTLRVLEQAVARGAAIANHLAATGVVHESGRAAGVTARDRLSGQGLQVRARSVVLATGPWGDRQLGSNDAPARIRPSKGVHLFFSYDRLPVRLALYLPTGPDDRLVFVVPWEGRVLVGTTDTEYDGPLDTPSVEQCDVDYLLRVLNRHFPQARFDESDVLGAQAGIRPLVASEGTTSRASREERIWQRDDGVIVLAGGKLTTYRRAAEKVAAVVRTQVGGAPGRPTEQIPIAPVVQDPALAARLVRAGLGPEASARLLRRYGSRATLLVDMIERDSSLAEHLAEGRLLAAEVVFAARHEQARTLEDVLARRSRLLILDHRRARALAPAVARLMASELGWDTARVATELDHFAAAARQYELPAWRENATG